MLSHGHSSQDTSKTEMQGIGFLLVVSDTKGERDAYVSLEHPIVHLSLLQSSEHSVSLFFLLYQCDKNVFSEVLEIKDLSFQFSAVTAVCWHLSFL